MFKNYSSLDFIRYGFRIIFNHFNLFCLTAFFILIAGVYCITVAVMLNVIRINVVASTVEPSIHQDVENNSSLFGKSIIHSSIKHSLRIVSRGIVQLNTLYKFIYVKNKWGLIFVVCLFICFLSWQALGLARIGLDLADNNSSFSTRLFDVFPYLPRAILADLLYYAILIIGLIFGIVPGVFWALRAYFYRNAILENENITQAFRYSFTLTKNNSIIAWACWALFMSSAFLNIIGWFYVPIGTAYLYRKLQEKNISN